MSVKKKCPKEGLKETSGTLYFLSVFMDVLNDGVMSSRRRRLFLSTTRDADEVMMVATAHVAWLVSAVVL